MNSNNIKKREAYALCLIEKARGHSQQGGTAVRRISFEYESHITQARGGSLTEVAAVEGKNLDMQHSGICI